MKNKTDKLSDSLEEQLSPDKKLSADKQLTLEELAAEEERSPFDIPVEGLRREAIEQISRERVIEREDDRILANEEPSPSDPAGQKKDSAFYKRAVRANFRMLIDFGKSKKTSRLLIQIWQSDYTIIAYALTTISFFLMKRINYPPLGVLFFLLAMAVVDAILSIFVTRLSLHQGKHDIYSAEDFERDWLRYRILLSMSKAVLLFVVGTSCGTAAAVGCYVMWFFTSTQRLRYLILRWSMVDHFPELERWSIFGLLREAGIKPKLGNYNLAALLGVVLGFTIALMF
jgi:Na+/melibiose symporter-like transporter